MNAGPRDGSGDATEPTLSLPNGPEARVEAAGDSLYLQRVPMQKRGVGAGIRIAIALKRGVRATRVGRDVVPVVESVARSVPPTRANRGRRLAFLGYGLTHERSQAR